MIKWLLRADSSVRNLDVSTAFAVEENGCMKGMVTG